MTSYSYQVETLAPSEVTGDALWTVVQYVDGKPAGGDCKWVRERFARRAAALYAGDPELHGKPTSVLRDAAMVFDSDEDHEREVQDHTERLRSAGFDVSYVLAGEVADARDSERVRSLDRHKHNFTGTDVAHVDLGRVAAGEDMANQTSTVERSNYRSIKRDLDTVPWVDVSYSNVDLLGAFVADLDTETVNMLVDLAEQYVIFDEDDMSQLEDEEITESVRDYVIFDVARQMDLDDSERWHDLDTDDQAEMIFAVARDHDLYPEHSGLEVIWNYSELAKRLTERL